MNNLTPVEALARALMNLARFFGFWDIFRCSALKETSGIVFEVDEVVIRYLEQGSVEVPPGVDHFIFQFPQGDQKFKFGYIMTSGDA